MIHPITKSTSGNHVATATKNIVPGFAVIYFFPFLPGIVPAFVGRVLLVSRLVVVRILDDCRGGFRLSGWFEYRGFVEVYGLLRFRLLILLQLR